MAVSKRKLRELRVREKKTCAAHIRQKLNWFENVMRRQGSAEIKPVDEHSRESLIARMTNRQRTRYYRELVKRSCSILPLEQVQHFASLKRPARAA